jgi:hypothetical protein
VPQAELFQLLQLAQHVFKALVEVVEISYSRGFPMERWPRLFASPAKAFGAARFSHVNDYRRTGTNLYRIFTTALQPQNICKVDSLEALWRA